MFSRLSIIWIIDKTAASSPRTAVAEWSLSHVPHSPRHRDTPQQWGEAQSQLGRVRVVCQLWALPLALAAPHWWQALHLPGTLPASRPFSFPHPQWWRTEQLCYWLDWFIWFPESCSIAFEKTWQNIWLFYIMWKKLTCFAHENKVISEAWFRCVLFSIFIKPLTGIGLFNGTLLPVIMRNFFY